MTNQPDSNWSVIRSSYTFRYYYELTWVSKWRIAGNNHSLPIIESGHSLASATIKADMLNSLQENKERISEGIQRQVVEPSKQVVGFGPTVSPQET